MAVTPSGMTVFLQPTISLFVLVTMMALLPTGELYVLLPSSTVMDANAPQRLKGFSPMEVTEEGIVIEVNAHALKALASMVVTELGMIIDVNELQTEKEKSPMISMVGGSVIAVKFQQPLKASSSMLVKPVKYCNSLNEVMVLLFLNTVPKLVTAAASA